MKVRGCVDIMRIIDKGRETPMRVSVAGQVVDVDVDADVAGGGDVEMRRYTPAT